MSNYFILKYDLFELIIAVISLFCLLIFTIELAKPVIAVIYGSLETFKKAGIKGYKSIIPFYNIYLFVVKICGLHWSFLLVLCVCSLRLYTMPAIIFINSLFMYNFAKRFNQNKILYSTLGAIIPPVFIIICGLTDTCKYDKKIRVSNCGYFNL